MLTGNSWDFQELQFFYLDPQIRAVAGTINERLLLLIYTIFTVFSAAVFLLHQIFCFQNKLGQLPLETTDLGHNPTSPDVQTQLGWDGRPLGRPRGTRVHTCTTSSQEGKHLKTLTNTSRTKPRGRQKSKMGPGREHQMGPEETPSKRMRASPAPHLRLNSTITSPGWVVCFPTSHIAGKSNESFLLSSELLLETMPENQPCLSTNQATARTWAGDILRVCCYS